VSQFVAVELSAVYHDVVKDRLYTDAANSPRRRSTQAALHLMVTRLCQILSPMLAFTTDEAWEFVPGRCGKSVHGSRWQPLEWVRPEAEAEAWKQLFVLRELALPELEKARQAKILGKALEARVTLGASGPALAAAKANADALRELLNVSQLELQETDPATVQVAKAQGEKCERCWHWETDVGANAAHPTLCGRCVGAVSAAV
jgi:isoleucyl-tRNA synthetase